MPVHMCYSDGISLVVIMVGLIAPYAVLLRYIHFIYIQLFFIIKPAYTSFIKKRQI